MNKNKKEIVAKCSGCEGDIYPMEKDIIEVIEGDFIDSDGLLQGFKTLWKGHKLCFPALNLTGKATIPDPDIDLNEKWFKDSLKTKESTQ